MASSRGCLFITIPLSVMHREDTGVPPGPGAEDDIRLNAMAWRRGERRATRTGGGPAHCVLDRRWGVSSHLTCVREWRTYYLKSCTVLSLHRCSAEHLKGNVRLKYTCRYGYTPCAPMNSDESRTCAPMKAAQRRTRRHGRTPKSSPQPGNASSSACTL